VIGRSLALHVTGVSLRNVAEQLTVPMTNDHRSGMAAAASATSSGFGCDVRGAGGPAQSSSCIAGRHWRSGRLETLGAASGSERAHALVIAFRGLAVRPPLPHSLPPQPLAKPWSKRLREEGSRGAHRRLTEHQRQPEHGPVEMIRLPINSTARRPHTNAEFVSIGVLLLDERTISPELLHAYSVKPASIGEPDRGVRQPSESAGPQDIRCALVITQQRLDLLIWKLPTWRGRGRIGVADYRAAARRGAGSAGRARRTAPACGPKTNA
jgi:hypothetical protein